MHEDLNDLLLFAEVARASSIAAAARITSIPKSTISRRLLRLEARVGSRLFYKTTRKITLTELGKEYLERCERVVLEVDEAKSFLDSIAAKPSGTLRLTMTADFGIHHMGEFLVEFARAHPDITLDLDFSSRRVDLVGERYDVAIRFGALQDSSLVCRRFLSIPRALYASPGYLARAGSPAGPRISPGMISCCSKRTLERRS